MSSALRSRKSKSCRKRAAGSLTLKRDYADGTVVARMARCRPCVAG
jgi:hypothetical protein